MDERQQPEQSAGPANPEEGADVGVEGNPEERLAELANQYRGKPFLTETDVEEQDREVFRAGWQAQNERWEEPYGEYVSIVNDINSYLSLRYKGVPDMLVASAAIAAGQHLMGLCTQTQIERMRGETRDRASEMANALAEKLGLAVAEPGGHG